MKKTVMQIVAIAGFLLLTGIPARASENDTAYLYFYTVDGEEIESLTKALPVGREYTFQDPDKYKYNSYEGADGKIYISEYADQVTGIWWEEEKDCAGTGKTYKNGDKLKLTAGEHFFRVKTDNPVLTGENTLYIGSSEKVHLFFYTKDYGCEIESLYKEIAKQDEYSFPDPNEYVSLDEETPYKGLYWKLEDLNGKIYLFKKGDKAKFQPGYYDFKVVTDEPVMVRFRLPIDVPTLLTGDDPGDLYAEMSVTVGETIKLKKSLGALVEESTFRGWEEYNYDYGTYKGGQTYRITDNVDLAFFAVYEWDENWDPFAVDENVSVEEVTNESRDFAVSAGAVNGVAGAGYNAYIDGNGKLKRNNNAKQINSETHVKGVPGTIKKEAGLTSEESGKSSSDPASYTKDKYGRASESSNISDTINGVLRQDDSALYMDIYGNSMIYHVAYDRISDLCMAYIRLQNKSDSFASLISGWDPAAIERFEAIEFSLLCNKYPGYSNSSYNIFNSNDESVLKKKALGGLTEADKLPEWKNEYLSEDAWRILSSIKKSWSGWLDVYSDGLEELYWDSDVHGYRYEVGSIENEIGDIFTAAGMLIKDSFCMTAYAAEYDNYSGVSAQNGARINYSLDVSGAVFIPQYFDPDRIYSFGSYGFATLNGLTEEQKNSLQSVFEYCINDLNFSEAMAAGVCGNIWQESRFMANSTSSSGAIGLFQWTGSRKSSLLLVANTEGTTWTNMSSQLRFLTRELNGSGYLKELNSYLYRYGAGTSVKTISDPKLACDAWCAVFEGCVCKNGNNANAGYHNGHGGACAVAANGKAYQHLGARRQYALSIYNAMVKYGSGFGGGGICAGMSNSEILMSLFGYPSKSEVQAHYTLSELREQCVSVKLSDGRSIVVHKAIAQDTADALNALMASGFTVDNTTYGWRSGGNTSGSSYNYSYHNLGLAIDINCGSSSSKSMGWAHNPQFYTKSVTNEQIKANYSPKTDPLAIGTKQAQILESYGLLWGRDFSSRPDIMHFSVGEVGYPGKNSWISNLVEGVQ